ncbi:MAG: GxxExxY protein [Planctomycetota bacterium]
MNDVDPKLNELTDRVIGAAISVHRVLGPGFLESSYQKALSIELQHLNIPHQCEAPIALKYRGQRIGDGRIDILVNDCLVLELKAVDKPAPIHQAQVISYLKATGHPLGLLINFNAETIRDGLQRIVFSSATSVPPRFNRHA